MWWRRTDLAYRTDTSGLYAPEITGSARRNLSTSLNVASFVVLALSVFGAVVTLVKRRSPAAVYLIVATLALAAVPLMLFGDSRYRVPAEPLFAVLAAAALGAAIDMRRREQRPAR